MANVTPLQPRNATGSAGGRSANLPTVSRADDAGLWARLMVLAQDGDKQAYHQLLVAITPYVRAIARRQLTSSSTTGADIEDAVQEVLLVVHSIRHTYERGRPFKPWLGTIASRRIIDLLRRRSLRDRHEALADEAAPSPEWTAIEDIDPERHAIRASASNRLRREVEALPARQREAVELLQLGELSLEAAAAASRQTIGALKSASHRALKSLQKSLSKDR